MNAYVARQAYSYLRRGVRINAILPGPTDTPLARAHADEWLGFGSDYRADAGVPAAIPDDQAYPLLYLCSHAASYITGTCLVVDAGLVSSGLTGRMPLRRREPCSEASATSPSGDPFLDGTRTA